MKRILLTGFEPFDGASVNVSQDVVNLMPSELVLDDPWKELRQTPSKSVHVELERTVLTVDEQGSMAVAERLQSGEVWDAIVHLGVCGECTIPRLEMRAQDRLEMRIPDNNGRQVTSSLLSGAGDLLSTAPIKTWLQDWDVEAELSNDAGLFLCNETLYRTLESMGSVAIPTLFVHLPKHESHPTKQSLALVKGVLARLVHKPVLRVAGALFVRDRQFLLARRASHEHHSGTWEFPGGKLESHETKVEAVIREIREEFGWDVEADPSVGTWFHELETAVIALDVLECKFIGQTPSFDLQERWTSHDRVEWHTSKSCQSLVFTGSDHKVVEFLVSQGLID